MLPSTYPGKFLRSWTSWWWQSLCRNVQGQGGQAVEVYLLNCGNKITFSSTADSWVICSSLKDVHKLVELKPGQSSVFISRKPRMCCKELFGATWKFRNGWASETIIFLSQNLNSHPCLFGLALEGRKNLGNFGVFLTYLVLIRELLPFCC